MSYTFPDLPSLISCLRDHPSLIGEKNKLDSTITSVASRFAESTVASRRLTHLKMISFDIESEGRASPHYTGIVMRVLEDCAVTNGNR